MKLATRMLYCARHELSPESFLETSIFLNLSTLAGLSLAHRLEHSWPGFGRCWPYTRFYLNTYFSIWTKLDGPGVVVCLPLTPYSSLGLAISFLTKTQIKELTSSGSLAHISYLHFSRFRYHWYEVFFPPLHWRLWACWGATESSLNQRPH